LRPAAGDLDRGDVASSEQVQHRLARSPAQPRDRLPAPYPNNVLRSVPRHLEANTSHPARQESNGLVISDA
jgi:hypothetical protein